MPNLTSRPPFEESLIRLRFIGPELDEQSIPIYELGNTLVAIQRLVNKAYLFNQHRLDKSARPASNERSEVALQLGARRKASDGYGLVSIVTDPVVIAAATEAVKIAFGVIITYTLQRVLPNKETPTKVDQELVAAAYQEIKQLTDRVGRAGKGKAAQLEISTGKNVRAKSVVLTSETKAYVKKVERETVYGKKIAIQGRVTDLDLEKLRAEMRLGRRRVIVHLNVSEFTDLQRRIRKGAQQVTFTGRPIFKLGADTSKYAGFAADSFTI